MKLYRAVVILAVLAVAILVWRGQLYTVARPGDAPRPLEVRRPEGRVPVTLDVVLPVVPAGMQRLTGGDRPLLIHYWAPWERHSRDQAAALDSLRREPGFEDLRVVVVCSDPFPSVARFVARHRLRLAVLLDGQRQLQQALPCPSIPYTYVVDRSGRIAVSQAGEVDWWSRDTRRALRSVLEESPKTEVGAS